MGKIQFPNLRALPAGPRWLAHTFVTVGGELPAQSDSEVVPVGGVDAVDAALFDRYDYAALGHIHKQGILIPNQMAYAGALEPLDRNHEGKHGLIKGEIRDGRTQIQRQIKTDQ